MDQGRAAFQPNAENALTVDQQCDFIVLSFKGTCERFFAGTTVPIEGISPIALDAMAKGVDPVKHWLALMSLSNGVRQIKAGARGKAGLLERSQCPPGLAHHHLSGVNRPAACSMT